MKDFIIKILMFIKNFVFRLSFTVTALIRWLSKKKRVKIDVTFDIEEEEKQRKEEINDESSNHRNF